MYEIIDIYLFFLTNQTANNPNSDFHGKTLFDYFSFWRRHSPWSVAMVFVHDANHRLICILIRMLNEQLL